ncbi:unnamed protein product [Echinostoma caproni]|uniref:Secreted protein n=1 Tax=Echinostoma caproni TaxID=27848 RepID=A0A183AXK3_9TREM|nr:unnamed protein product [Echinostoma caproni]
MTCSRTLFTTTIQPDLSIPVKTMRQTVPVCCSRVNRTHHSCSLIHLILVSVCMHTVCPLTLADAKAILTPGTHSGMAQPNRATTNHRVAETGFPLMIWNTLSDRDSVHTARGLHRPTDLPDTIRPKTYNRLWFLLARERYHSVRKCCEREVMKPVGGGHLTGTCCTELRYMDAIIHRVQQWAK